MPNCTVYAYGRVYELLGRKPKSCEVKEYNFEGFIYPSYEFNEEMQETPNKATVSEVRQEST